MSEYIALLAWWLRTHGEGARGDALAGKVLAWLYHTSGFYDRDVATTPTVREDGPPSPLWTPHLEDTLRAWRAALARAACVHISAGRAAKARAFLRSDAEYADFSAWLLGPTPCLAPPAEDGAIEMPRGVFEALDGQRVLIISPFAPVLERQWRCGAFDLIHAPRTLVAGATPPRLAAVRAWRFPYFCFNNAGPHARAADTADAAWAAVRPLLRDVDVALVSCGSYGIALTDRIAAAGFHAVYAAGELQVLFGVLGGRWRTSEFAAVGATRAATPRWCWIERVPSEYVPPDARTVENGAYF